MGLDIYVGPLCRYHGGDWKTIVQQAAEAEGVPVHTVWTNGEPDEPAPRDEILAELRRWKANVNEGLRAHGGSVEWEESFDLGYVTDKPGWQPWTALILKYCYLRQPELRPSERMHLTEDFTSDPAFVKTQQSASLVDVLLCEMWLPGAFRLVMNLQTITGRQIDLSSLALLNEALDELCAMQQIDRTLLQNEALDQPFPDAPFEEAARYAASIYCRLADEARRRNLPMVLDS